MREKAEENKSKQKLEDYKMHIVRSLMQKNQTLEEIETKLTRMEKGDDPVQNKILDKINELEKVVESKQNSKKLASTNDNKINQMMDYMMYNMSSLQQMMYSVAQMQKAQYESSKNINNMISSLPQILSHVQYQNNTNEHKDNDRISRDHYKKDRHRKKRNTEDDYSSKSHSSKYEKVQKDKKEKEIKNRDSMPSIQLDTVDRLNLENIKKNENVVSKNIVTLKSSNKEGGIPTIRGNVNTENNNNSKKVNDNESKDDDTSGYQESIKPDSITMIRNNETIINTMMKDESKALSEGRNIHDSIQKSQRRTLKKNTDINMADNSNNILDNNMLRMLNKPDVMDSKKKISVEIDEDELIDEGGEEAEGGINNGTGRKDATQEEPHSNKKGEDSKNGNRERMEEGAVEDGGKNEGEY